MTPKERFNEKWEEDIESGCWVWMGAKKSGGYGSILFEGKKQAAHRVSWILHNGPIPPSDEYHGMCVCHKCDQPLCVNPDHLFLDTQAGNVADRDRKGRHKEVTVKALKAWWARRRASGEAPIGEASKCAKLTEAQAIEIHSSRDKPGIGTPELAKRFGVSTETIRRIWGERSWKHLWE